MLGVFVFHSGSADLLVKIVVTMQILQSLLAPTFLNFVCYLSLKLGWESAGFYIVHILPYCSEDFAASGEYLLPIGGLGLSSLKLV